MKELDKTKLTVHFFLLKWQPNQRYVGSKMTAGQKLGDFFINFAYFEDFGFRAPCFLDLFFQ